MSSGSPLRLGFPVKVLGEKGLKSNDSRRWQSAPHLRVSIGYLLDIFYYLQKKSIRMYRMSSDVAPYATHPDLPEFHGQIRECRSELRELGDEARRLDIRLSMHPSQFVVINSPDEQLVRKSIWDLESQADLLDCMELGPEAVLVIHAGGAYGDTQSSIERWVRSYEKLSPGVKRRLVLENDDTRFSAANVLWAHERTGVPLIFDVQHHCCLNPEGLPLHDTFQRFLRTWPEGVRPKMHFSSPRTEMRQVERTSRKTGKKETVLQPPIWTGHADFNHPFEFIAFMRQSSHLEFDVMLEAKAKDLALIRLRQDLLRYAPEVAERFGLTAAAAPLDEEIEAMEIAPEALSA
ncbi:MAG TPA: UV DNA damage repair endonuclease UvsE [Bryobacteraceae bacterium]|nr:UV DNA damage repair endonuclease UvsE [Bryobacteraceae bacterium]